MSRKSASHSIVFPSAAVIAGVLGVFVLGGTVISSFLDGKVLGIQIAKGGDDDGGGDNSGSGSSGSGGGDSGSSDSDSGSSGSGSSDSSGGSGSNDSGSGSSGSSGSGSGGSDNPVNTTTSPTRTETRTRRSITPTATPTTVEENDNGLRTRTETKADEKRSEIRLSETERIRVRTKDGETRVDITSGGIKTRLEYRDDRVIIKAEYEDGTEVELADDTIFKITERLDQDNIKIATGGGETMVLQRNKAAAITEFPLSVDLATNTLTITTPAGEKTVTVLPDQAVLNLLAANVITKMGSQPVLDTATSGNLTTVEQVVTLGEENGVPVYEIAGVSEQRLLWFIPVEIEKNVTVSAETGEVLDTDTSFIDRIVDFLSVQ